MTQETILPFPLRTERSVERPFTTRETIAVAVPHEEPTWLELGSLICSELNAAGAKAELVYDGDLPARRADRLLLLGSVRYYSTFARQFQALPAARPVTILWQLQPLPPPLFTQRAETLAQRMISGRWSDLLGTWAGGLDHYLPFRRETRGFLQAMLSWGLREELEKAGPGYGNVGRDEICGFLEEAFALEAAWGMTPKWIDAVHADSPSRVLSLRQRGIEATYTPLGYHAGWGEQATRERDVDVVFLGDSSALSRESAVPQVLERLRSYGYSTLELPASTEREERCETLSRSRVMMNVLRLPWEFPVAKLYSALACGTLTVTNAAVQTEPCRAGEHFVESAVEKMADTIAYYLHHEEVRLRFVKSAQISLAAENSLAASLGAICGSKSVEIPAFSRRIA